MRNPNCDPLALTATVNALAVAIAEQLGDTLATIAAQRAACSRS